MHLQHHLLIFHYTIQMSQANLTCYRCGQGGFTSKQKLGGHMTSCTFTGTTYDQFNEAEKQRKRKHEQIETSKSIYQQLQEYERHSEPIFDPHRSRLSVMPSLDVLASSNQNTKRRQVITIDIDGAEEQQDHHVEFELNNDAIESSTLYEAKLTPALLFQVHLEHELRKHREVDLCLQDEVIKVLRYHTERGADFNSMSFLRRPQLIARVAKTYDIEKIKPVIYRVPVRTKEQEFVSVAVYNVREKIFPSSPIHISCKK